MGFYIDQTSMLVAVAMALGAVFLLLLLFIFIRRSPHIQSLGNTYLVATCMLGVVMLLDAVGVMGRGWPYELTLTILVIIWGYVIFDLIEDLLFERTLRHQGIAIPQLVRDILRGVTVLALLLVAINRFFGVPFSSLIISSTVLSAVVGLALQDLLKDVVAGIALQIEKPFAPGDWIEFEGQNTRIIEMNWRATRAVNANNTHLIVPNATMAAANVRNYSIISPLHAINIQIVLAPEHPPHAVKEVLLNAIGSVEQVLREPPATVRLHTYGEYSLTYDVRFWVGSFDQAIEVRDAVMTSIWYHIRQAEFRLPTPLRDVYLHDPEDRLQAQVALHQGDTQAGVQE
ncbi:cyclic nucleotide-regulated small mechanosensitive ion channel [Oscillochloris trichoides DG-6]|uniref:Cyclic nucleotide-regulated small mechanosensitive ion channel n=1 Tax=Oscillochloris trichoides DG-6 TaxID=765420 RepID=E1ID45_9CHLR|nr:mechanosensitive ion channel domain-containing protein [Oscillochloris trichoides]EFO80877.1 cyclic nucleotide-regulated small mechanosensitive ion channel [Oscillochloris trichoides DG-6]